MFQEKNAPFTPYFITLEDELLERGREIYDYGLHVYQQSMEKWGNTQPWRAFDDKIEGVGRDELEFHNFTWYLHKQL